jgi:uncharacterized protein YhaN
MGGRSQKPEIINLEDHLERTHTQLGTCRQELEENKENFNKLVHQQETYGKVKEALRIRNNKTRKRSKEERKRK